MRPPKILGSIVYWCAVIAVVGFFLIPIGWAILSSFKSPEDVRTIPPKITFQPTLENYITVFSKHEVYSYLSNTVFLSVSSTVIVVFISSLGGYCLSRFKFPGSRLFANLLLVAQTVPWTVIMLPLFFLLMSLALYDTYHGLMITYVAFSLPFSTWLMRGFFLEVPREFEESAIVDGCSPFWAFLRIALPIAAGGLVANFILVFVDIWQDFLIALVMADRIRTINVGLTVWWGSTGGPTMDPRYNWAVLCAAGSVVSAPPILFAFFVQKYLVKGLVSGVIKR